MDIMSWEIAEVVSPCLPRSLWSHIVIRVFLLLGTVCLRHPPYPVLPSCPLSRAFPYPQLGDAGGRRSAPAVCQSLTSADSTTIGYGDLNYASLLYCPRPSVCTVSHILELTCHGAAPVCLSNRGTFRLIHQGETLKWQAYTLRPWGVKADTQIVTDHFDGPGTPTSPVCVWLCGCVSGQYTHTTHNHFTALWTLSGTTRVSWHQKVHFAIFLIFWSKMKIMDNNICKKTNDLWPRYLACLDASSSWPFLPQRSRSQVTVYRYRGKMLLKWSVRPQVSESWLLLCLWMLHCRAYICIGSWKPVASNMTLVQDK